MDEAIRETEEIRAGVELLANLQVNILEGFGVGSLESEESDIDSTDEETDLTFCEKCMLWFPGGPPLTFLPFPVPDGDKRPGSCPNHEHCGQGVELPPSDVLQKAHSDGSTDAGVLSVECTLPVEKVNIWLDHLTSVAANRKRGKAKAAETRSSKKRQALLKRIPTKPGGDTVFATNTSDSFPFDDIPVAGKR
ncbi:hypothetical protein MAR_009015 [Mya arenaria]|uniref:Uncharacterized protein n=1 Tax=Mya arenaria TaxID=6604 RepID=A0ABY7E0U7_MYAAR|nr:hypothetical protein MAR_009015 [Mya arenaria]